MLNEGNQTHNFISRSGSRTVINYGSGSDFLTSYGSGSTSQKVTVPVPQRWLRCIPTFENVPGEAANMDLGGLGSGGTRPLLGGPSRPARPIQCKEFSVSDPDSIRIRHFRLSTDPDPDPEFWSRKIEKNLQVKKNTICLSLGLHNGRPSYRRSLQPSKDNIQHFKTWYFSIFQIFGGHFCPFGSWSGFRIRIHWPDWIRIRNTAFLKDPISAPELSWKRRATRK